MKDEKQITEKEIKTLILADTPLSTKQLLTLLQKTPANHKYSRPAKGGGNWDYVTGVYVKKTLNYVFGWLWSFDIISMEEKYGQVICQGKLTVNKPDGSPLIWKTDIGRADLKMKRDGSGALDYGNDQKAAATDCLKRCAFQLGIASDIYGKNEFKEINPDDYTAPADDGKPATTEQIETIQAMGGVVSEGMTKTQAALTIKSLIKK